MQQAPDPPLHADVPRSRLNITLILAGVVALLGVLTVVQGNASGLLWLILGFAGVAYAWLTTPKQFQIYVNALVIVYGAPRIKVIPYPEISHLDLLAVPMGNRLRVRMENNSRLMISVQNLEEFQARLEEAMEKFRGSSDGGQIVDQGPTPY